MNHARRPLYRMDMEHLSLSRYLRWKVDILAFILVFSSFQVHSQTLQSKIELNHKIYMPEGSGPFPAIIAIPGCSGVSLKGVETDVGRPGDEGDRLFRRHYSKMAEKFQSAGYLVLLIDYLTAENVDNTCGWEIHPKRVGEYIKEAIQFAEQIQNVDTTRISVVGWSHGGEGIFQWLSHLEGEPNRVRSAVAVYPGCSASKPWKSSLPVLILIGESDDIALPSICHSLIQSLSDKTNVSVISYQNARHGFDLSEGPKVLPVGTGMTIGRNKKAGEQAWQAIVKFLNEK
jgi:dienelactone hydrolase